MNEKQIKTVTAGLKQALTPEKVITDSDILDVYSRDETSDLSALPDILVRAEDVEDVSKVLAICNKNKVPLIARGGGSGVTGGAVPVLGGVLLSLEKMNRIIEIDRENMVAVVEPGVITDDLKKAVLAEGLFYPPDPASLEICSIGGNVAENAGGPGAVKYGTTKDYVLGLEFVLPDGSVINTGGKVIKDVTGFNLIGILLGSEGTLAVITKVYLRLIPSPGVIKDILIPFNSIDSAIEAVYAILHNKIIPATIEFMEENAIKLVGKHFGREIPHGDAKAHLLIRVDGYSEEDVDRNLNAIAEVVDIDGDKIFAAESDLQREKLWKARRSIREALHIESPVILAEDCCVPISVIPKFVKTIKEYLKSRHLISIFFGHAGDGNVHIDILKGDMEYKKFKKLIPEIKKKIYGEAISLGGTITGEHGIGYTRKDYLHMQLGNEEIELLKRIKKAFDPNMILNPGKIFTP
ncbi:FAD-binding oxidoreductase [Spirochaetota bacterium]